MKFVKKLSNIAGWLIITTNSLLAAPIAWDFTTSSQTQFVDNTIEYSNGVNSISVSAFATTGTSLGLEEAYIANYSDGLTVCNNDYAYMTGYSPAPPHQCSPNGHGISGAYIYENGSRNLSMDLVLMDFDYTVYGRTTTTVWTAYTGGKISGTSLHYWWGSGATPDFTKISYSDLNALFNHGGGTGGSGGPIVYSYTPLSTVTESYDWLLLSPGVPTNNFYLSTAENNINNSSTGIPEPKPLFLLLIGLFVLFVNYKYNKANPPDILQHRLNLALATLILPNLIATAKCR